MKDWRHLREERRKRPRGDFPTEGRVADLGYSSLDTKRRTGCPGLRRWRYLLALGVLGSVGCHQGPTDRSKSPRTARVDGETGGWGIDAYLSQFVATPEVGDYIRLLQNSGVTILRERGVGRRINGGQEETFARSPSLAVIYRNDPRPVFRKLKASGKTVVAFAGLPEGGNIERIGDVLPENLIAVYQQGKILAGDFADTVDAWELVGEPDVGYCTDLPDRVVAYQKAMYLGLKAGAAEADERKDQVWRIPNGGAQLTTPGVSRAMSPIPLVLMGALALPPGPWLARATRNGLLDYTDAYNFHFYGNAGDLSGVIAAHDRISRHWRLPLWITECGINAVAATDFLESTRRQLQAKFTVETARQALSAPDVAIFMPFILVHKDDPHEMTLSADKPLPAWEAYARFTREHVWPQRPLSAPPNNPNPVVVQWMPDVGAAVAHKVSGTYRFWQRQPMHGEIRIYNFSEHPKHGRLLSSVPAGFQMSRELSPTNTSALDVPAEGRVVVPVAFTAPTSGYASGECEFEFIDSSGRRSHASFGLEVWPEKENFIEHPLELRPLPNRQIKFPEFSDYRPGEFAGPWQTINGLHATAAGLGTVFWTDKASLDPLMPAMAFAAINGVPNDGFLRVQLDQPMAPGRTVRVDLVDADGQRFCIWENLGQSYFVKSSEVWLNVHDMQIYFWGHCLPDPTFHPERVKEIQLWFYRKTPGEKMRIQLSWMTPKKYSP